MSAYPFGGKLPASGIRACRKCGCTQHDACIDKLTGRPCHWVEDDLCSACDGVEGAEQHREQARPALFAGPKRPLLLACAGTVVSLAAVALAVGGLPL